jgi:hypothetical protein
LEAVPWKADDIDAVAQDIHQQQEHSDGCLYSKRLEASVRVADD